MAGPHNDAETVNALVAGVAGVVGVAGAFCLAPGTASHVIGWCATDQR